MDEALLKRNLAQAQKRVAEGERHLRAVAAQLQGKDDKRAAAKLQLFEQLQTSHIADRDHLLKELGQSLQDLQTETSSTTMDSSRAALGRHSPRSNAPRRG